MTLTDPTNNNPTDRAAVTVTLSERERSLLVNELDLYAFSQRALAASTADELAYYEAHNELAAKATRAGDNLEQLAPGDIYFSGQDRIAIMGALSSRVIGYRQMAQRLESQGLTANAQNARVLEGALVDLIGRFNMDAAPVSTEMPDPHAYPGHSEHGD
jgi:hypothetical protein